MTLGLALALALAALAGCGGGDESSTTTTGASPIAMADLDLCALVGPEPPAAFLSSLEAGPVDREQGSSTDDAAVCGWFLAPVGDARPEGVVVRVEPITSDGNPACDPPGGSDVADLELDRAGTSWLTLADGRVDAAATTPQWCLYVRGPLGAVAEPDVAATSTRDLFDATLDALGND
jgi:hypothetical protein